LSAAACGGSKPSRSSGAGTAFQQALEYARCVRSNGIPNWPDPTGSGGQFDKSNLTLQQLGVSGSRLQAAETACRHLLPNGGRPPDQAHAAIADAHGALVVTRSRVGGGLEVEMSFPGAAGPTATRGLDRRRVASPPAIGAD
jgi:hypothetical protein